MKFAPRCGMLVWTVRIYTLFKARLCRSQNGLPCGTGAHFCITYQSDWYFDCINWKGDLIKDWRCLQALEGLAKAIFFHKSKNYVENMLKQPQWHATFFDVCHQMPYKGTLALFLNYVLHTRERFLETMHTITLFQPNENQIFST